MHLCCSCCALATAFLFESGTGLYHLNFFFFFRDSVTRTSFGKSKKEVCRTGSVSPPDDGGHLGQ